MILYYKNSFIASILSLTGCVLVVWGIRDDWNIPFIVMGIPFIIGGKLYSNWVAERKAFKEWWKQITATTSEQEIRKSRELAVAIYKKNPNKHTLNKIRELNPKAAFHIESGYQEPPAPRNSAGTTGSAPVQQPKPVTPTPVQQNTYQPPVQQNTYQPPVQQNTYQPPVQQNTYQPPVQQTYQPPVYQQNSYQAPVYQQPVRTNMIRGMDGKEYESVDAYIDDVVRLSDNYKLQDPDIYWQCYTKLEWLLEAYPNHERLISNLANMGARYAWLCDARTFEDRQKGYRAAVSSLNYGNQSLSTKETDIRKFNLLIHAVHGGITAGNSDSISSMETAMEWLRTASGYWFENPDEQMEQYRNVAVPSVRMYVGYWLAKEYMKQNPANKQKARAVLEEVLQCCPFALIRNCDINPNLKADTKQLVTREDVMELWRTTA